MDQNTKFDQMFSAKFSAGLNNIKFFISPNNKVSADEIRADVIAFQTVINDGKFKEVDSVD